MNIRNIIDNYTECNNFEIKYQNKKITVFYYDKIETFKDNSIIINYCNNKVEITGSNLIMETMFKEYFMISGNIKGISFN